MEEEDRSMDYEEKSTKRLNVSVDEKLHTQLKMMAAEQRTTIAQFVAEAIREKIERGQGEKK